VQTLPRTGINFLDQIAHREGVATQVTGCVSETQLETKISNVKLVPFHFVIEGRACLDYSDVFHTFQPFLMTGLCDPRSSLAGAARFETCKSAKTVRRYGKRPMNSSSLQSNVHQFVFDLVAALVE